MADKNEDFPPVTEDGFMALYRIKYKCIFCGIQDGRIVRKRRGSPVYECRSCKRTVEGKYVYLNLNGL